MSSFFQPLFGAFGTVSKPERKDFKPLKVPRIEPPIKLATLQIPRAERSISQVKKLFQEPCMVEGLAVVPRLGTAEPRQ